MLHYVQKLVTDCGCLLLGGQWDYQRVLLKIAARYSGKQL